MKKAAPFSGKKFSIHQASIVGERYWWYQARQDWVARVARHFLPEAVWHRILISADLGCGAGGLVKQMQTWGDAWGLEPDPGALVLARSRGVNPVRLIQGRMEHMPRAWRGFFDLVTCLDVLEHIRKPQTALREAERILAPGGVLLVTVPGDPGLWSSRDERLRHVKRYTVKTLRTELESAGFEILRLSPANAFYYWPFKAWRTWARWQQKQPVPHIPADTFETTPLWSWLWRIFLKLETAWWLRAPLPWGVSIAAAARKPEDVSRPYPKEFVFGTGEARPEAWSLSGLKIRRALQALRGVHGRVLEMGCGGGQYLRALRRLRPDLKTTGIDLDAAAVQASQTIPDVLVRKADATRLPFKNNSFSAVLGFDILEHVKNPAKVLKEAARVLKPGGLLHLYVPCEGNPGTIYQKRGHALKARWGGHVQQFTTESLLSLIQKAGFTVQHVRHTDYALVQHLDYAFYQKLSQSPNPRTWWAGQALQPGGGWRGGFLRAVRRLASALGWAESSLRSSRAGSMGVHITALRIEKNGS